MFDFSQLSSRPLSTSEKRAGSLSPDLCRQGNRRQLRPPPTATQLSLFLTVIRMTRSGLPLSFYLNVIFFPLRLTLKSAPHPPPSPPLHPRSWFWCCRILWLSGKMRSQCFEERKSRFCRPTSRVRVWFTGPPTASRLLPRDGCHGACSKHTDTHTETDCSVTVTHTSVLQTNRVKNTRNLVRIINMVMSTCSTPWSCLRQIFLIYSPKCCRTIKNLHSHSALKFQRFL